MNDDVLTHLIVTEEKGMLMAKRVKSVLITCELPEFLTYLET